MANRISLNPTSYHGAGAVKEIVTEAKANGFTKAFVASDPDLVKFGVIGFASAILVFRKRRYNTFEEEEAAVEVAETSEAK